MTSCEIVTVRKDSHGTRIAAENYAEARAAILAYFERRKSGEDASDSFADAVLDSFCPEWRNCPEGYSHTAHQQAVIWKRNRMRAALHAARTKGK